MNIFDRLDLSNKSYKAKMTTNGCLASTSNNTLFSCFAQGVDTDNYIIKVLRSNDNGISWTDTNFPILGVIDHNTPCMVIDSSNIIHVVFTSSMSAGGSLKIYYSNSNNGGSTWSTPVILQPLTGYDQLNPKLIFDKKNNVLSVVWYGTDSTNGLTQIKHCRSMDNGATWSYFKNVAPIPAYAQSAPKIILDTNGSIYIFWHGCDTTNTTKSQIKFTKSIDYGASWLAYANIALDTNFAQMNVDADIDSSGVIYVAWQQADTTHPAQQIKICKSSNGGAVWSTPVTITDSIFDQETPDVICSNNLINIFWRASSNTTVNHRIKYSKTTDLINFMDNIYITAPQDDVAFFSLFNFNGYLLITYESFLATYIKKYGYRKYLFQDGTDIKYSIPAAGTPTDITLAIPSDGKTFCINTSIQKGTVTTYDIDKLIASTLYTPNYTTGDIVFTTARAGAIKFNYTGLDASSNPIPNQTQTVSPQADGKTYKLNCKIQTGSITALEGSPILIDNSTYMIDYANGVVTFVSAKVNSVKIQYTPITRTWTTIGQAPATAAMFTQYGHDEVNWMNYNEYNKLNSIQPYIIFSDKGMEYSRPEVIIKGDALSKYRYEVTMDDMLAPLKSWTEYMVGNINDSVIINSNNFSDSEPKNIYINLEQYDDGVIVTRRGTVTLNNNAPTILAQINGTRLDLTINDPDSDKICFNIYANGTKVYPLGQEYTPLLDSPNNLTYIFKTEQIKIDENNIIVINAKDEFNKKSMVRLDFIGEYVGLIFVDSEGNRYSTDQGTPLKTLDMGTIQAGSDSNIFPVYLKNSNGFDVKNISIWGDGVITNGQIKFSKTINPFVEEDMLEYQDRLLNESNILFYIKVDSQESILPGGGDFRVLAKAQIADSISQTQMPLPDPNGTVIFNVVDSSAKPLHDATISFDDNIFEKTNVLGKATFNNVPILKDISYTIIKNGYQTTTGTTNIATQNSTNTVDVTLSLVDTKVVTFKLLDGTTPIPNAKITIKGQTITIGNTKITYSDIETYSDYNGESKVNLVPGNYNYSITSDNYINVNDSFTVNTTDMDVTPTMSIAYLATFNISNGTNPIEYANLNINSNNITANYNGVAIAKLANGTYTYTISATGYQNNSGTITIANSAITQPITLTATK